MTDGHEDAGETAPPVTPYPAASDETPSVPMGPLAASADAAPMYAAPASVAPTYAASAFAAPPPSVRSMPLVPTSRLLATSFDLLARSGPEMRRASFYIGAITLGTVGPLVLASWAVSARVLDSTSFLVDETGNELTGLLYFALTVVAMLGLVAATVESRTLAVTVLGGTMAGRPISTRQALARSRRSFWRAVAASIIVAIPLTVANALVTAVLEPIGGVGVEVSVITSTLVTAGVGAPFAYILAGVVLGDVDPLEALKRSFKVYGARRVAAVIVVVFETVAALLILLGISAGLDVVLRVFDALGLGLEDGALGTLGLALATAGIVAVVFAFGTLLFTVMAITVAPQVVMFLGLTHATFGLDRVVHGGPDDPDVPHREHGPFRWFTRPMLLGFIVGGLALAGVVSSLG
ncbi:MAG: hypothetical protein ABIQ58_10425 [Candidatus Limnocylindrales bacterium]